MTKRFAGMKRPDINRLIARRSAVEAWRLIILIILLPGLFEVAACQKDAGLHKELWIDYNPSKQITETVELFGDIGGRWLFQHKGLWRLVIRPGIGFPAGNFKVTAGIGNFLTFSDEAADRWEIRPYQGIAAVWPRGAMSLDHLLRLEERFDFNTETWKSVNSLRARYRLRVNYKWGAVLPGRFWIATAAVESFYTLSGKKGASREEARVTLGIDRGLDHARRICQEISWQDRDYLFPTGSFDEFYYRIRYYRDW